MMDILAKILGLTGASFVLYAYIMISQKKWSESQKIYHFFNIIGAGLILFSLSFDFNIAAFVIQIFWIAIGLLGLYRLRRQVYEP